MDSELTLLALLGAAGVGILAVLVILRRLRREAAEATRESPIAASGEGAKLCPSCATENLWSDSRCVRCGKHLPDVQRSSW